MTREQPLRQPRSTAARLAGAPISWGACEVPGRGAMPDSERMLVKMAQLHRRGTELGVHGYDGWLVLEQDTAIAADEPAADGGPMRDAAESIGFIHSTQTEESIQ